MQVGYSISLPTVSESEDVELGSDTTSTTIAGTFYYFSRYPAVYEAARNEVRGAFATATEIRLGPSLNQCVYLRACINETLRISPSVGSALWREIVQDGAVIDGHFFQPGIDVGVGIYSIHHNPLYYPDPFVYRPERWLTNPLTESEPLRDFARDAFSPFSKGPRSCVGKGLAMVELMLTFACVLWSLDWEFVNDKSEDFSQLPEFKLQDHVTSAKNGPVLRFRQRV